MCALHRDAAGDVPSASGDTNEGIPQGTARCLAAEREMQPHDSNASQTGTPRTNFLGDYAFSSLSEYLHNSTSYSKDRLLVEAKKVELSISNK